MADVQNFICPHCSQECSVAESLMGQNLVCPHCAEEFFAAASSSASSTPELRLPEKLPFFKGGRRKILEERLHELSADGIIDENEQRELVYVCAALGLDTSEIDKLRQSNFFQEFEPIKKRMEATFMMTDEDLAAIS